MTYRTSKDEEQGVVTWLERDYPNYAHLLEHRAENAPDQFAYGFLGKGIDVTRSLTYKQVAELVRRNAVSLQTAGAANERVLLVMASDLDYTIAFLSCIAAGAIAITTIIPSTLSQVQRLEGIIEDSQAKFVIASSASRERLKSRFGETRLFSGCEWLSFEALGTGNPDNWTPPRATWSDVAFLQYTSGSTSAPKGVEVTHRNLARIGHYHERVFGVTREDIGVTWLPQSHDMGLIKGVLQPLFTGYPTYVMTPLMFLKRPLNWLKALSEYGGTTSIVPNFTYDACVKKVTQEDLAQLDLSQFKAATNAAEPIRATTLNAFLQTFRSCGFTQRAFHGAYGMAETSLAVTATPRGSGIVTKIVNKDAFKNDRVIDEVAPNSGQTLVSSGRTQEGVEVVIADLVTRKDLGVMSVGEILVRGDIITKGYWKNETATQETFNVYLQDGRGPFLRTEDLGFLDEEGELFVTGRVKDIIIIHGKNYAPHDIEFSVEQLNPEIRQSYTTCFSVDVNNQEAVVIIGEIAKEHQKNADPDALSRKIMRDIAKEHQVPVLEVLIVNRGQCPKTTSGKIQRRKSRDLYLNEELDIIATHIHPMFQSAYSEVRACA